MEQLTKKQLLKKLGLLLTKKEIKAIVEKQERKNSFLACKNCDVMMDHILICEEKAGK